MVQALPEYDYIFAVAMLFAFLDAWNIGANDIANSFATSVSSRSLTLTQAMMVASIMEPSGGILVGARVTDTIRTKIVKVDLFVHQPGVLMLGMLCALIGSSAWLTIATAIGLPVSTTHSIVGGIIGMGIATVGFEGINWGWKGEGVAQIFASWLIAPAIAGAFAAILFSITKYGVLKRQNPLRWGMVMVPIYFGITSGILTMLIVWKGAPSLNIDSWNAGKIAGTILGTSFSIMTICTLFFLPFLHRRLIKEDWTLMWYDIFYGPLLLRRGPVPEVPEGVRNKIVQDYYRGHATREELEAASFKPPTTNDLEAQGSIYTSRDSGEHNSQAGSKSLEEVEQTDSGKWYTPKNLRKIFWDAFMHGVRVDVISAQSRESKLSHNITDMHARAAHFDNKTEHLFSFIQVLTAATSSFAHGSNDVANATGPLTTIFLVWSSGVVNKKADVPLWILAYGGVCVIIGLWTYGYNIMRNLGNRLTLHSPSRGFSMELGSAITVVMATRLSLPVSTTQCIVGATMGVAFCNGDFRALNWRMVVWCYGGWIFTLPAAGLISGCVMAFIINAPRWDGAPT